MYRAGSKLAELFSDNVKPGCVWSSVGNTTSGCTKLLIGKNGSRCTGSGAGSASPRREELRKDGMALFEKGVQRTPEPIVIDLLGRHIKKNVGAAVLRPFGDIPKRHRATEPCSHEQAQSRTVVVLGLRISGKMLVDDIGDLHPLQERRDDSQRPVATAFDRGLVSVPSECHSHKMAKIPCVLLVLHGEWVLWYRGRRVVSGLFSGKCVMEDRSWTIFPAFAARIPSVRTMANEEPET